MWNLCIHRHLRGRCPQELRTVDPDGFQRLWRRGVMLQHDCSPASPAALAADYLLTAALTAALAAGLATAWYRQVCSPGRLIRCFESFMLCHAS